MKAKLIAVLAVAAVLLTSWRLGVFDQLAEPKVLARSLVELGTWGFVAFIVAYALLHPFGVPGTIFVVASPLIWPWPTAFALSMIGTMAGSVIGFAFARFVARDWVQARIHARLRRYEAPLAESPFQTVAMLRLLFWMPQPLHFFFGVSRVPFWTHFWGSLVGYVPPLLVVSYFGARMFDGSGKLQPDAWPIMGALVATSLLIAGAGRFWERRRRAADAQPTG